MGSGARDHVLGRGENPSSKFPIGLGVRAIAVGQERIVVAPLPITSASPHRSPWLVAATMFVAVTAFVAPVGAHVAVAPAEARAGVAQRYVVTVPSEKTMPTTRVEIDFPAELRVTDVDAPTGWTATRQTGKGGRLVGAVWSGGSIPPEQSADFGIVARNPDSPATLRWKVIQTYRDGSEVHWTGPLTAEFPAAVTVVRRSIGAGLVTIVATVILVVGGAVIVLVRRARRRDDAARPSRRDDAARV